MSVTYFNMNDNTMADRRWNVEARRIACTNRWVDRDEVFAGVSQDVRESAESLSEIQATWDKADDPTLLRIRYRVQGGEPRVSELIVRSLTVEEAFKAESSRFYLEINHTRIVRLTADGPEEPEDLQCHDTALEKALARIYWAAYMIDLSLPAYLVVDGPQHNQEIPEVYDTLHRARDLDDPIMVEQRQYEYRESDLDSLDSCQLDGVLPETIDWTRLDCMKNMSIRWDDEDDMLSFEFEDPDGALYCSLVMMLRDEPGELPVYAETFRGRTPLDANALPEETVFYVVDQGKLGSCAVTVGDVDEIITCVARHLYENQPRNRYFDTLYGWDTAVV